MSDAYGGIPPLTDEQRAVVELPADAMALVTAPAGAGKTYTLVRRLDRLVAEEDLSAGEILVLTFSRAAVRELRERLLRHGDAARHVRVQTFDSWALDMLTKVDEQGGWYERSFDDRIKGALDALEKGLADDLYEDLLGRGFAFADLTLEVPGVAGSLPHVVRTVAFAPEELSAEGLRLPRLAGLYAAGACVARPGGPPNVEDCVAEGMRLGRALAAA